MEDRVIEDEESELKYQDIEQSVCMYGIEITKNNYWRNDREKSRTSKGKIAKEWI